MLSYRMTEKEFQNEILNYLQKKNKYEIRKNKDYNMQFAFDIDLLLEFIENTQKELVKKYKAVVKTTDYKIKLIEEISLAIKKEGLLHCFKNGVYLSNIKETLQLIYFKPVEPKNTSNTKRYDNYLTNIFSVMEEVVHKNIPKEERIDLVIFINGIPVITMELKCEYAGQSVKDAIEQYKNSRTDTALLFKHRSLVNFAVDTNEIYMTTNLCGVDTKFIPFNDTSRGSEHLWERILVKDNLLTIIFNYIISLNDKGYIFPRYHQFDLLQNIKEDLLTSSSLKNYLFEHSPGSGKTYSISWLSKELSTFYKGDTPLFDKVIIITDRTIVDAQLQKAVKEANNSLNKIELINKDSSQLAKALNDDGIRLIVSTVQKFKFVLDKIKTLNDKNFAIIIDEAHSSTDGQFIEAVKVSVTKEEDEQDTITIIAKSSGKLDNLAMFAFTATPKESTLNTFGTFDITTGKNKPFHIYSMEQAIREGFILNVLKNYRTVNVKYKIEKTNKYDPVLKTADTKRKINTITFEDECMIKLKVEKIVNDFIDNGINMLNGKAKAMILTGSRISAVKFKKLLDEYCFEQGINFHSLVAFTGEIEGKKEEDYNIYKGKNINENVLKETFRNNDDIKFLIVADKYQTGYDEPLLCFMYVDKVIKGIKAVQSLSRINRAYPNKKEVFVMDFVNNLEDIKKSFKPYYTEALLDIVEMDNLDSIKARILDYNKFTLSDVEEYIYYYECYETEKCESDKEEANNLKKSLIRKIEDNIFSMSLQDMKYLKSDMKEFLKTYDLTSQKNKISQSNIELYYFLGAIYSKIRLKITNGEVTEMKSKEEIRNVIAITNITIEKEENKSIEIDKDITVLSNGTTVGTVRIIDETKEKLSKIINEINAEYGKSYSEKEINRLNEMINVFFSDEDICEKAIANTKDKFKTSFEKDFKKYILTEFFKDTTNVFYSELQSNEEIKETVFNFISECVYNKIENLDI